MKIYFVFPFLLSLQAANSFVSPHVKKNRPTTGWMKAGEISTEEALLNQKLEDIAHKLKLQVFMLTQASMGSTRKITTSELKISALKFL